MPKPVGDGGRANRPFGRMPVGNAGNAEGQCTEEIPGCGRALVRGHGSRWSARNVADVDRPVTGVHRSEVSGDSFSTEEQGSGVRVIDRDRLDELRELEADSAPGLVATLFHSFLTGVQADLDALARAAERGDATVLGDLCHRLKGTTLTLGAGAASEACAALESAASAGRVGLYPALLAQLELECARVAADVDGWAEQ